MLWSSAYSEEKVHVILSVLLCSSLIYNSLKGYDGKFSVYLIENK